MFLLPFLCLIGVFVLSLLLFLVAVLFCSKRLKIRFIDYFREFEVLPCALFCFFVSFMIFVVCLAIGRRDYYTYQKVDDTYCLVVRSLTFYGKEFYEETEIGRYVYVNDTYYLVGDSSSLTEIDFIND